MVPIDDALNDLSTLATKLSGETEKLNEVIKDLNAKIGQTGIGVSVWLPNLLDHKESIEYEGDTRIPVQEGWEMGYGKIGDEWMMVVRRTRGEETVTNFGVQEWQWNDEDAVALAKAPRHVRVEAAAHFEPLVLAIAERAKAFIANIEKAKKLAKK